MWHNRRFFPASAIMGSHSPLIVTDTPLRRPLKGLEVPLGGLLHTASLGLKRPPDWLLRGQVDTPSRVIPGAIDAPVSPFSYAVPDGDSAALTKSFSSLQFSSHNMSRQVLEVVKKKNPPKTDTRQVSRQAEKSGLD